MATKNLTSHMIAVLRLAYFAEKHKNITASAVCAHRLEESPILAQRAAELGIHLPALNRTCESLWNRGLMACTTIQSPTLYYINDAGKKALKKALEKSAREEFSEEFGDSALDFLDRDQHWINCWETSEITDHSGDQFEPYPVSTLVKDSMGNIHMFAGDMKNKISWRSSALPVIRREKDDPGYFQVGDSVELNCDDDMTGLKAGDFGKVIRVELPTDDRTKTLVTIRVAGFNGPREWALFAEQLVHSYERHIFERRNIESDVFFQYDTDQWIIYAELPIDQREKLRGGDVIVTHFIADDYLPENIRGWK